MSLYGRNNFGYLQQAEAFFLSHSQVGLMLGSKDTEMLRQWRNAGVPIEVVCAGIQRAFEQFQEPPRRISNCRRMIDKELQAWRTRQAGAHGDDANMGAWSSATPERELPDPTDPTRRRHREALRQRGAQSGAASAAATAGPQVPADEGYLELWYRCMWRLTALGRDSETAVGRDAYRWAYKQMQALRAEALEVKDDERALSRLGLAIGEIEASMYERYYEALSAPERERVDARLPSGVNEMLSRMSPSARARQQRTWRRRLLEEAKGFHPFFTP